MIDRIYFHICLPFEVISGKYGDWRAVLTSHDECNTLMLSVAISVSIAALQLEVSHACLWHKLLIRIIGTNQFFFR